ncbi:MAG: RlmE family RNA methyltransferase [Candidatus Bathyarchaeia archaeon]
MSNRWIERRKRDYYYRRAKEENYRSRAAYKLKHAVKKYGFIKPGDVVIDLGAAPGGWLQVVREIIGDKGFVLGVDTKAIESLGYENVYTLVGDIMDPVVLERIKAILPRLADVVLSDVSPNISGIWELDHARQIELAERSLQIASSTLRKSGSFFVKVFQGELLEQFLKEVGALFSQIKIVKPEASRKESAEIYVLGLAFGGEGKVN